MKYRPLGTTDLQLSVVGLGSMTWGEQNTESEAHEQINYALERGVNFIDTAEMYPVPAIAETAGLTEQYIGTWLQQHGRRNEIILASKVVGPAHDAGRPGHIRPGQARLNKQNIKSALEDSLRRLQTDYIDLYQLHWPERVSNYFGTALYPWPEQKDEAATPILETLEVLNALVLEGKIRHIGVSNETPWGLAQFLKLSEQHNLPRVVSIQNPYNLLNRSFEVGLSEFSYHEKVSLLAYSPLGMGVLSGKYLHGQRPAGARLTLFDRFQRYSSILCEAATEQYVALAHDHQLSPATLANAFVQQQPFVASNIIGATNLVQLKENIDSANVLLDDEVLRDIAALYQQYQSPAA